MPDPSPNEPALRLRVLASGSAGNCALLTIGAGVTTRAILIDIGLSPRRTRRLLAESAIRPDQIDHILVTHFDRDHCHPGWANADLGRTTIHYHVAHTTPARRLLGARHPGVTIDTAAELQGLTITTVRLAHDDEGVTAFRIDAPPHLGAGSLGYATDLGRATDELIHAFTGVGTLAIESNYCPELQHDSPRPAFLKDRIMNGRGHLSNQQAAEAAARIRPAADIVLLHLSRECNTPERALAAHDHLNLPVTISDQIEPTAFIPVATPRPARQPSLFNERP